jgi:hypothetical protein
MKVKSEFYKRNGLSSKQDRVSILKFGVYYYVFIYNFELYKLCDEPDFVKYIKINRLKWAWHVMRIDNNRITKRMFNTMTEGKIGTGRPKLRCVDSVDHDIRILGGRYWRNLALNREEWRKLLKKARAHAGLLSQC